MPYMLSALDYALSDPKQIVIVGQKGAQSAQKLRKEGVLFREGVYKLEDKTLFLDGIPDKAVKGAAKKGVDEPTATE